MNPKQPLTHPLLLLLLLLALLLITPNASAVIGANDTVPAATLLLPYFEVELGETVTMTTLFAVNNALPTAVLAHVTLWSDRAVPTLAFDISLVGFDVQAVSVRDIFTGNLPNGTTLDDDAREALVAAHTGQPNPDTDLCSGSNFGDNIARGYITIDVVNQESQLFPNNPGYFVAGGLGVASNQNALWGDFAYFDPVNDFAHSENLVHIEASSTDTLVTTPGNRTFYGSFLSNTAADNREPLPTTWGSGYNQAAAEMAGTSFIYWRDPGQIVQPHPCATPPTPFPLAATDIVAFDEFENPQDVPDQAFFPNACGRVDVTELEIEFEKGWVFFNLNVPTIAEERNSYLLVIPFAEGRFTSMFNTVAFD